MYRGKFKEQQLLLRKMLTKNHELEPYLVFSNYDLVQIVSISKRFIYYIKDGEPHKLERQESVLRIFVDKESAIEFLKEQVAYKVKEYVDLKFLINKIDRIILDG